MILIFRHCENGSKSHHGHALIGDFFWQGAGSGLWKGILRWLDVPVTLTPDKLDSRSTHAVTHIMLEIHNWKVIV